MKVGKTLICCQRTLIGESCESSEDQNINMTIDKKSGLMRFQKKIRLESIHIIFCPRSFLHFACVLILSMRLNLKLMDYGAWWCMSVIPWLRRLC